MQTSHAWLAGIIDGEGCFTLFMKGNRSGSGERIKSVTANVTITNSSATIIDRCSELLNQGGVKYALVCPRATTGRTLRRLSVRNYDAIVRLLDMVDPYLVGKTDQSRLMRDFVERAKTRKLLPPDERQRLYDEMRRLNRFGNLIP